MSRVPAENPVRETAFGIRADPLYFRINGQAQGVLLSPSILRLAAIQIF